MWYKQHTKRHLLPGLGLSDCLAEISHNSREIPSTQIMGGRKTRLGRYLWLPGRPTNPLTEAARRIHGMSRSSRLHTLSYLIIRHNEAFVICTFSLKNEENKKTKNTLQILGTLMTTVSPKLISGVEASSWTTASYWQLRTACGISAPIKCKSTFISSVLFFFRFTLYSKLESELPCFKAQGQIKSILKYIKKTNILNERWNKNKDTTKNICELAIKLPCK